MQSNLKDIIFNKLWWIRQILLTLTGCFFLFFGIQILIAAYSLKNPFFFIMTFFASNLIILISATLIIGFIYKMLAAYKITNTQQD
ncbi:conserved hypothetical protein [Candidatus Magnetomoraceae bacterium gMMP-15]